MKAWQCFIIVVKQLLIGDGISVWSASAKILIRVPILVQKLDVLYENFTTCLEIFQKLSCHLMRFCCPGRWQLRVFFKDLKTVTHKGPDVQSTVTCRLV